MRQITITEVDDGYLIDETEGDSAYPQTHKRTARETVARIAQLLNTGPIAPQIEPESVCIGSIETE